MINRSALAGISLMSAFALSAGAEAADTVFIDDVIVDGSLCAGLDCVENEAFGFATIRLKENNARIDFVDTSISPGFPGHDWRLEANSSQNSGPNHFAIVDMGNDNSAGAEFGNPLLVVRAGAPVNSLFVATDGSVGLGTNDPKRTLSLVGSDMPTIRLEQDDSEAAARIWDLGADHKQFFVRDVTGNNKRPFRIRAGAPSSSLEINKSGRVGIGVASPKANLHVAGSVRLAGVGGCSAGIRSAGNGKLSCITSSRQFKIVTGDLSPEVARANIMALRPQTGAYKQTPDTPEHWLIAEEVAAVEPAFVGLKDDAPYTVKMQNIVADLIAVVQEQQRRIEALERELAQ